MRHLELKTLHLLTTRQLVRPGEKGLICLSGGVDSMALACLLNALAERLNIQLEAIHFDHGLRPESAREAQWVGEQATALGLPFHLKTASHLARKATGIQAEARAWRLAECHALLKDGGFQWAGTGHQANDQQETLLMKLLRGCHLSQLRGMDWQWGPFIRPLLGFSHQHLKNYLQERQQPWLEDPSNRKGLYKRNRVRNELIPLMDELSHGHLTDRLKAIEQQAQHLEHLLNAHPSPDQDQQIKPPHWIEVSGLRPMPVLARAEAIYRFIQKKMPGELDWPTLEKAALMLESTGPRWCLHLSLGRQLERLGNRLVLSSRVPGRETAHERSLGHWCLRSEPPFRVTGGPAAPAEKERPGILLEQVPHNIPITIRSRRPGDRFQPHWREKPLKLKDFLRDQGIPLWQRDRIPLVVVGDHIAAVYPDHIGRAFSRSGPEENRLWLEITGDPSE